MLDATALYKAALLQSHTALTRAVLLNPLPDAGFEEVATLSVSSGRIRLDSTRNVWRSGNCGLVPTESIDRSELELIDSRSRLRIDRGIQFPDLSREWVTIGLMQTQSSGTTLTSAESEQDISDLASLVEDDNFITPYVPQDEDDNWLTTVQAIMDLVATAIVWDEIPGWDIDPGIDTVVSPVSTTVFTGSRWSALQSLAESIGAVVYAQPNGRWRIRSVEPDLDNPVAEFSTGRTGTVSNLKATRTRAEQFNGIPLRWEGPSVGGLVFIVDADPLSPTYWNGPFGRKPREETTNDLIVDEDQAIAAATALLAQYKGIAKSLSIDAVHNPLLEPMDVILVRNGNTLETHVVDSIDYPLTEGQMSVDTRLLRVES